MALDSKSSAVDGVETPVLKNLLAICGDAVAAAAAAQAAAADVVRGRVSDAGKISSKQLEIHQHSAHGLAWIATYVES